MFQQLIKPMFFRKLLCKSICLLMTLTINAEDCSFPDNFCEAYNRSDEVFSGLLILKQEQKDYWVYTFKVITAYKGVSPKNVIVMSYKGKASICNRGPDLIANQSYLVYVAKFSTEKRFIYLDGGKFIKPISEAIKEIGFFNKLHGKKNISVSLCLSRYKKN